MIKREILLDDPIVSESIYHKLAHDLDEIEGEYSHVINELKRLGTKSEKIIDIVKYQHKLADLYPTFNTIENQKRHLWLNEIIEEEEIFRQIQIELFIQARREDEYDRAVEEEENTIASIQREKYLTQLEFIRIEHIQQLHRWKKQYETIHLELNEQIKKIDAQISILEILQIILQEKIETKRVEVDLWLRNIFIKGIHSNYSREINMSADKKFRIDHKSIFKELHAYFYNKIANGQIEASHVADTIKVVIEEQIIKQAHYQNLSSRHIERLKDKKKQLANGLYSDLQSEMKKIKGFQKGYNNLVSLIACEKDLKEIQVEIRILQEEKKQVNKIIARVEEDVKDIKACCYHVEIPQAKYEQIKNNAEIEIPRFVEALQHNNELQVGLENEIKVLTKSPASYVFDEEDEYEQEIKTPINC